VSKAKSALCSVSFRSTRIRTSSQAGSSRVDSEMEADPPSPTVRRSNSRRQSKSYTFLRENQIKFQDDCKKKVFKLLKDKEFTSTPLIDVDLLQKTSIDFKFELIFRNIGWEEAWHLNENGSRFLIIEFMCTLQLGEDEISFGVFNQSFSLS
jgi:hypothetical protein